MLLLIVAILSFSGFRGVYAFRQLTKVVKARATELPLAAELALNVSQLRVTLSEMRGSNEIAGSSMDSNFDPQLVRERFRTDLMAVRGSLRRYKEQLDRGNSGDTLLTDDRRERETVQKIEATLDRIEALDHDEAWVLQSLKDGTLKAELAELQELTSELPTYMTTRMDNFAEDAKSQYRTWIFLCSASTLLAFVMLIVLVRHFHKWVFCPLRVLIQGSRRVAHGDFEHVIQITTHDEVAELAAAMNDMTRRFKEIRDDLDRQVKERTKEVVRSERLASVGFLAAGVAHEINNPLASIAWAAEALESRIHETIQDEDAPATPHSVEMDVLQKYLRRIQDEAFRCKGITERLLDFSRMGDVEKTNTNLAELIEGVIDMVRHLGKYREKHIKFYCGEPVFAPVNAQEIKQVVLNLITNGLDSLDPGGVVTVELRQVDDHAELMVRDDGCGMSEEVLEHLFEPFFTRRRDGQGTGLGLSITYRIVADHGGKIQADSDGPGRGSSFRVTLPLEQHEKAHEKRKQVA